MIININFKIRFMYKILLILILFSFQFNYAYAYIGIGPLIPLIGNAIVFIFLGIIGVLGFIVYPFRKIYSYIKGKNKKAFFGH